ncbi:MAG: SusC/RagA family TonB-linked outer membrane protein [Candidatus Symbiothrix sp.]|jgi:TonB-linked SusC/RagA family outer membrane protein|nr:SusC/RagA family TonB-linked outer membrane protein [Candidatus Symbiothrix sp.]
MMKKRLVYLVLLGMAWACPALVTAQDNAGEMIRGKVVSETGEELIFVPILEIDKTDRVVSNAQTDMNGEFSMKIKNRQNRLKVSYVGFSAQTLNIGSQKVFNIVLRESNTLKEVTVTAKRTSSGGTMDIPVNEISFAMQKINTKEFEGLQVTSIDDALRGQIAGLDIVGGGNVGQGSSMRLRGTSSISANSEPLIVINGVPRNDIETDNFDFATMNDQQLADLLSVHPDDILEVQVLKDAASTAIWGSKGASGVLMITLKRGNNGQTRVQYKLQMVGKFQQPGLKMLNGGDYLNMMQEAIYNVGLNTANIPQEFQSKSVLEFSEAPYFAANSDWRSAVIQPSLTQDHYLSISGGGEKASFRISGGYSREPGTIIGQDFQRFTSRMTMDYDISQRIQFGAEFGFTYADNKRNWSSSDSGSTDGSNNSDGILAIAYKKMPSLAIYDENGDYYAIQPVTIGNSLFPSAQKYLRNPVAQAMLATNTLKSHKINPILKLRYDLLDPEEQLLRFKTTISFNMNGDNVHKFLPKSLFANTDITGEYVNRADDSSSESTSIYLDSNLQWKPKLSNEDHSLMMYGGFKLDISSSTSESISAYALPDHFDASAGGYLSSVSNTLSQGRSMTMIGQVHYAYKGKYIADVTLTREGSTKFGPGNKFGYFPGISLRWNISDEPFMDFSNNWLDMLSVRPSWGISGTQPGSNYLHYSQYAPNGTYAGNAAINPSNLRLSNLKWEKKTGLNLGFDLAFLDNTYTADVNLYHDRISDALMANAIIPTSTGFASLSYSNCGVMDNDGWELTVQGRRFLKIGNFSMDFTANFANNVNTVQYMPQNILDNLNEGVQYGRAAKYMGRVELGKAFGSIYGYRYLGTYQYNIESYKDPAVKEGVDNGTLTMPVARDANGGIIYQANGQPLQMVYNADGVNYKFKGGDAMYEDVNHDGNIDMHDMVYLGNSNPLIQGGFSVTFRWKELSMKLFSNYRVGNMVINQARRNAENMYSGNNQSIAVNYRWRREGDGGYGINQMPRALYSNDNYNSLPSDRFVEDASFLRFNYIIFNYSIPSEKLKKYFMKTLNLSMTLTNLYYLTTYQGLDPEVGLGGYTSFGMSTDNSTTPRPFEIQLGITVGF